MNNEIHLVDLGFVNAYLIKVSEGFILIDSGVGQQWSILEKVLLQSGALPEHLLLVVVTHGDFDHTGNCAELQRKYHTQIAMHPEDVEMVRTGSRRKRQARNLLGKLILGLGRLMRGNFQTFQPDILLQDGQSLDEFGLLARVVHTPGHTKGSIAILSADGQLFVGDTLSNRRKPASAEFIDNQQDLETSLRILKCLQAVTIYPGHGKPFGFNEISAIPE